MSGQPARYKGVPEVHMGKYELSLAIEKGEIRRTGKPKIHSDSINAYVFEAVRRIGGKDEKVQVITRDKGMT